MIKTLLSAAGVALLLTFIAQGTARAADGSWDGGSTANGNWATAQNWIGDPTAPGATTGTTNPDNATFNAAIANTWGLTGTPVVTTGSLNISGISFDKAAGSYFIGATGGNAIKLSSGGAIQILNTLTATNATETINAPLAIQGAGGAYTFANNSANGTGAGAGTLNIGGGITGGAAGATVLTLGGSNTNSNTVSGIIANGSATSLSLIKSGAGTWALGTNTNTFTGTVTVEDGTLSVSAITAAIGTSSSVILGKSGGTGTLKYTSATGGAFAKAFTMAAGGTGEFQITTAAADLALSTAITGSGSLTKTGAGTLSLSGVNTYSGGTTVSAGTLSLANTSNTLANTAEILVNGGTLDVANSDTVGAVTISSGTISGAGTLTAASYALTDAGTISAPLGGSGSLIKTGAGTLVLSGANTFTGTMAVEEGTLSVGSITSALGTASTVTLGKSGGTGTLYYTGAGGTAASRTFIMAAGGIGAFQVDSGTTLPISGVISGSGGLSKIGAGTLNLSGANTYSGDTTVSLGTLVAGNALAFQNSTVQYSAGTVQFATGITAYTFGGLAGSQALSLINAGSAAIALTVGNNNSDATYSGALSGAGASVIKTGTGAQILSGSNTYTGATTVSAGTLQFAKAAALYNSGTGSWTAANINVKSGATFALNVDSAGTAGFDSAKLNTLLGNLSVAGNATSGLQAGAKLAFDTSTATGGTFTQGNAIGNSTGTNGGAIGFTKLGTGTLVFDKTNTYTGATTVSGGTLVVGGAISGSSSMSVAFGATLASGNNTTSTVGAATVHGTLAPGSSAGSALTSVGILNVNGNLTLGAIGTTAHLAMEIGGTTAGLDQDQVKLLGASTLNLTNVNLDGSLINSFTPTVASDSISLNGSKIFIFDIAGSNAVVNTFANATHPGWANGYDVVTIGTQAFLVNYSADAGTGNFTIGSGNDIALMAVPEPETWAMVVGGFGMLISLQRMGRRHY